MFELAGAKFIGNEFMSQVKKTPTSGGTPPAKAADARYRYISVCHIDHTIT